MPNGIDAAACRSSRLDFWVVWSPFEQFLTRKVFESEESAKDAAVERALKNPGVEYYVLKTCSFVCNCGDEQVIADTAPRT